MLAPKLSFQTSMPFVPEFWLDETEVRETVHAIRRRAENESEDSGGRDALRIKTAPKRVTAGWTPPPDALAAGLSTKTFLAFELKARSSQAIVLAWALRDGDHMCFIKERFIGSDEGAPPPQRGGVVFIDAVTELLADVLEMRSGILVTHGLARKAAIVHALLLEHKMQHLATRWMDLARFGLCLASHDIDIWLEACESIHGFGEQTRSKCMKLLFDCCDHATMKDKAILYLEATTALQKLARPPCARGEAPHDHVLCQCGLRDNGEHYATCRVCGQEM